MSDWNNFESFHDANHGEPFYYFAPGDEQWLTENESGILRPDVEKFIKSNELCARRFLQLVSNGELDFRLQERIPSLLVDLHQKCFSKGSAWQHLQTEFSQAMRVLAQNIDLYFEKQGCATLLDEDDLSFLYNLDGGRSCINSGLGTARVVALKALLKLLAERLSGGKPVADLSGEWELIISNPHVPEFAEKFAGDYGGPAQAKIVKISDTPAWRLTFTRLPLGHNWYSLHKAAYEAAAPIIAQLLYADVELYGDLSN